MSTTALEVKVTVEQSIALANSSSPIAQDDKDKKDKIAGLDLVGKLQILLVFPKNSQEYKLIYQGFLKIRVFKETESFVKNSLVMLLNHKGSLTLPLKQEKLNKLPNLLDKETDTFQYDYCIKLLQDLAEKKKLVPLVVANLQSLLEKQQEFSNSLILTLVTILLKNCYVSLSIEDKNKIKVAIKNFLSQMDAEPIEIPKDLIPLLRCLRQFLHHFNQELRLEARSITEALRIPLEIHDMLSLSIDGMQHGREKAEDLVLVVGASGSGKSTLINCLGGVEHYFVKDPATDKPYLRHKLGQKILVKVGHSSTSETLYPLVVQSPVTFKRTKSVKLEAEEIATEVETDLTEGEADTFDMGSELKEITELFAYADTPGFDDNRDEEEATCAALGVPLATHYAKKIRALVVVVPWIMTEPNSREHVNAFRLLCQTVDGILKDSKALLKDKDDKSPVPLIFAISKPPRPERGECFDAEKLRTKLENRIKEIKFDREKKYADLKNQEENKCVLEQNIVNLELCLNELPGFNSVDKMGLSFLARFSKRITEGERALAIKEQSQKWKASGIPQECVEKLELVLRKSIIAVAENSSDSEVIENFRQEWEREKNRFKGEFDKLSKSMEEIMSEKTMLDLMTQRSDNVFFIRGYQDSEEDTPDHREEFLNYLKWLREEEIYITEENFEFDATSEKFKRVTDWASNFASKMNEMLVGLLELPDRIDKNDAVIQSIKNDIEKKKTLLKAELTATEQEVEHEIQKTIRAWELERLHTAKDIKTLEEENDKIVAKIRAIDESPAIEYRSRLFKSTWFASHIRFYEFPGRQPKRTPANANRGWWNRLRGHYPDGHDIIPIERVELSCTVDKQSRLVFKTSISKDNTQFQGCTILSDSSIDLVPHSLNPDIVEIYPKKGSDLTKNGYFQYDPQNDLSQGQFSVKYYLHFGRMQRQDQYGIRIFVLLKNIPTYRYEKERLQAEMNRKEREIQERIEDQKRLEKDIKVFEEYLSLMKRGFNDQKNKMSTIQSLIQELDYSKGEFLKLFGGVASHIVWLVKPGNYEMLSRFLNCTEEQARKLGLERKWLAACIVGEDQERTSSKKLNDIEFQENLMEVPENFFKDMYPVLKTTGLTLNSLATIVGYLDSPTLATSALATPTLSKKLEIQELKKAGNQYLFESLRALYLSHDLRVRTLDQVISLLRFDNDRDIKNYLTASTAVKAKNIIGRCYSAIDKNVLKEVINSLFDTSVGLDAWVDCHRYGIKMDYLRSISGRAKPDDDSQNSVTRHLIEIYTKLYEAVKQGNKNACLDLLSGFFALDTNALPMTF
jgi:energy-coupling factor transporter ATP-binding protein EcfA2